MILTYSSRDRVRHRYYVSAPIRDLKLISLTFSGLVPSYPDIIPPTRRGESACLAKLWLAAQSVAKGLDSVACKGIPRSPCPAVALRYAS